MMFFQIALLMGYLYAHGLRTLFSPRTSWIVHCAVLLAAVMTLPVLPADSLKPIVIDSLPLEIVKVLAWSVGLPFFVLATTGPLIQAWQSVSHQRDNSGSSSSPYRLYALSNVGSLLALLSYPFLFEPNLRLVNQSWLWSGLFVLFAAFCIYCGSQVRKFDSWGTRQAAEDPNSGPVGPIRMMAWLVLAMIPSVMLLATTNLLCQEIASVPFLWILPLAIYLISFIICFDKPCWYHRGIFVPLLLFGCTAGIAAAVLNANASALLQILLLSVSLISVGMTCHGELERLKPDPRHLTLFYLFVSLGGSLGGIFVVLVAPRVFVGFPEFQLAIFAALIVGIAIPCLESRISVNRRLLTGFAGLCVSGVVIAGLIDCANHSYKPGVLVDGRNEYGIFLVEQGVKRRTFVSGQIDHGSQIFVPEPSLAPHGYYVEGSGFDVALKTLRDRKRESNKSATSEGLHVGVLGLGIGSMLGWAEPEDRFTFYEINPNVEEIARNCFTFLDAFDEQVEVVIGDGRIMLESETKQGIDRQFDLLAIDAFSSDSIPIHLLTDECFDVYEPHLKEDGILLFHISNRFINLKPVLFSAAKHRGLVATYVERKNDKDDENDKGTDWILITNDSVAQSTRIQAAKTPYSLREESAFWTDDFASVLPLIDWRISISWHDVWRQVSQKTKSSEPKKSE